MACGCRERFLDCRLCNREVPSWIMLKPRILRCFLPAPVQFPKISTSGRMPSLANLRVAFWDKSCRKISDKRKYGQTSSKMPLLSPLCDFAISSFACQIGASKLDSLRRYTSCRLSSQSSGLNDFLSVEESCLESQQTGSWDEADNMYLSFAFSLSSLSPTLEIRQKPKLLCQRLQGQKCHISRILSFCTTVKAISCSSSTCVMSHCGHDGTPFLILDVFQQVFHSKSQVKARSASFSERSLLFSSSTSTSPKAARA